MAKGCRLCRSAQSTSFCADRALQTHGMAGVCATQVFKRNGRCLCCTIFGAGFFGTGTSLEWMAVRAQQRCRADGLRRMSPPEKKKIFAVYIFGGFYTSCHFASPQKNLSKKDVHSRACRRNVRYRNNKGPRFMCVRAERAWAMCVCVRVCEHVSGSAAR